MITKRHLNILKSASIGISADEVAEWIESLTSAYLAGAVRIGVENVKLIDKVAEAWVGKRFLPYDVHEYTYAEQLVQWLTSDDFIRKNRNTHDFILLPQGHAIKAVYVDGQVVKVEALTAPGEYNQDVTDTLAQYFPSGVDSSVQCIYAVLSAVFDNWAHDIHFVELLLSGKQPFISGVHKLTLSSIEGCEIERFCDNGILGALSIPIIHKGMDIENLIDSVSNTRTVLVALRDGGCNALYCSRVQIGEILTMQVCSGSGNIDTVRLSLDSGDDVYVTDLISLRGLSEGSEIHYIEDNEGYVLSDEYGNAVLGAMATLY